MNILLQPPIQNYQLNQVKKLHWWAMANHHADYICVFNVLSKEGTTKTMTLRISGHIWPILGPISFHFHAVFRKTFPEY